MAMPNGTTNHGRKGAGPTPGSWKKGQSGNPKGRPQRPLWQRGKGMDNATAKQRAEQYVDAAFKLLNQAVRDKESPMAARVSAANSILDRAFGKAPQDVNVRGSVEHHIITFLKALDSQGSSATQLEAEQGQVIDHEPSQLAPDAGSDTGSNST